jgi:hypothetical protein
MDGSAALDAPPCMRAATFQVLVAPDRLFVGASDERSSGIISTMDLATPLR